MKSGYIAITAMLFAAMPAFAQEWVTLVDAGQGLENFTIVGEANWRVEDGALVADGGGNSHLMTTRSYRDFEVRAEFWADHTTNSGIFLRISDPAQIGGATAYEINLYDQRPVAEYGTGAIVNYGAVSEPLPKVGGQWNVLEVSAVGQNITVTLNGRVTSTATTDAYAEGPLSLQYGLGPDGAPGGAIKWRKVQVREL